MPTYHQVNTVCPLDEALVCPDERVGVGIFTHRPPLGKNLQRKPPTAEMSRTNFKKLVSKDNEKLASASTSNGLHLQRGMDCLANFGFAVENC